MTPTIFEKYELGFEMAARAIKEGIKIRQHNFPDGEYIYWKTGMHLDSILIECEKLDEWVE